MTTLEIARAALKHVSPEDRAEIEKQILALERTENASPAEREAAQKAFESDLQPVRDAIVEALQSDDLEALRGLRAMLPELLVKVNANGALADHFAFLLGTAVVQGLREQP
ncbi:MAG: hypothetical protein ABIT76_08645 [Chthoniobacterales bacterium]